VPEPVVPEPVVPDPVREPEPLPVVPDPVAPAPLREPEPLPVVPDPDAPAPVPLPEVDEPAVPPPVAPPPLVPIVPEPLAPPVVFVPLFREAQPVTNRVEPSSPTPIIIPRAFLIFMLTYFPPLGGFVSLLFLSLFLRAIRVRLHCVFLITRLTVAIRWTGGDNRRLLRVDRSTSALRVSF
jgi:hypothetical protein